MLWMNDKIQYGKKPPTMTTREISSTDSQKQKREGGAWPK